jgi:hypothetical protein
MTESSEKLLADFKRLSGGCYTERDGGPYYVVAPGEFRIAEGFDKRDDARALVCWLAGEDLPKGWVVTDMNDLSIDVEIPKRATATIWTKDCRKVFPQRIEEMDAALAPRP